MRKALSCHTSASSKLRQTSRAGTGQCGRRETQDPPFRETEAQGWGTAENTLALEDILVHVQRHLLGLPVHAIDHRPRGIADDSYLANAAHSFAKIGINGNKHRKTLVHFALRDLQVHLDAFSVARLNIIFELVARNPRSVYPFLEKPVELPVALEVHLFRHMLFGDGLEGLRGSGRILMAGDEIMHHVNEV